MRRRSAVALLLAAILALAGCSPAPIDSVLTSAVADAIGSGASAQLVTRLGTTVELNVRADDLDATWLERWFRDVVIARIPGGRHAPE